MNNAISFILTVLADWFLISRFVKLSNTAFVVGEEVVEEATGSEDRVTNWKQAQTRLGAAIFQTQKKLPLFPPRPFTFLLKTSTLQSYFKKYGRDQAYFYGLLSAIKYLNLLNLLIYWSILCTIKKYVLHLPKIPFRISAHSSSSSVNLCFISTFDFSAMFSYILSQRCDQLSQSSVMETIVM